MSLVSLLRTTIPASAVLFAFAVAAPRVASAEPWTDFYEVNPDGNAVAVIKGKPPWCNGAKLPGEPWERSSLRRTVATRDLRSMLEGAERYCEHAEDPTWQKQIGYLVQNWMNVNKQSQADAEKDITEKVAALRAERNPDEYLSPEERKAAFATGDLSPYEPQNGADAAKITGKPAWCDKAVIDKNDEWSSGRVSRTVRSSDGIKGVIEAANAICKHADNKSWQLEAQYILQKWMNWSHQTQTEAEASLRARIQQKSFQAQKDALCKELEPPAEIGGSAKTVNSATRRVFGCQQDGQALWLDPSMTDDKIGFYLDVTTPPDTELLRLYWLFGIVGSPWSEDKLPSNDSDKNRNLLYYAVAQWDFAHIDQAALDKMLGTAPFNSEYARTVINETVSLLKARARAYEAIVEKMSKGDEDYTAILRTAPKGAFAQWDKLATQWKAEVARSDAFEKKLSSPSHKALKGCQAELQKDAEKMIRSFKTNTYQGLVAKIAGDPIAILLLSRLSVCDAAENVFGVSGALADLVKHGRDLRGPRSLAYYAVVDAVQEAKKDRPRLLFGLNGFWYHAPSLIKLYEGEFNFDGSAPTDPEKEWSKGVVAAVTPGPDGILVTFKTVKITFPEEACSDDTRHPLKIRDSGTIEYYRNCKATGKMLSQDKTPAPITIAPSLNTGVKVGSYVVASGGSSRSKSGKPQGAIAYVKHLPADKSITTFFGFSLSP